MIVAATGHRPDKLGGYEESVFARLDYVARNAVAESRPDVIISGMALGWDMAVAKVCVDLGVPFVAAVPWPGQAEKWPEKTKDFWRELLELASTVHHVSPLYYPGVFQARNEWMVDRCHEVLALYNGSYEGGTYNCVRYARRRNKPVHNVWNRFREVE